MNMGGLMGEMIIMNVDKKVYSLLKLAEVIGVGKATVFGLGKIKIEEIG
jgi:CRISPR/Cas system endoribonuclease Cas6 (RAMP superfamily)